MCVCVCVCVEFIHDSQHFINYETSKIYSYVHWRDRKDLLFQKAPQSVTHKDKVLRLQTIMTIRFICSCLTENLLCRDFITTKAATEQEYIVRLQFRLWFPRLSVETDGRGVTTNLHSSALSLLPPTRHSINLIASSCCAASARDKGAPSGSHAAVFVVIHGDTVVLLQPCTIWPGWVFKERD